MILRNFLLLYNSCTAQFSYAPTEFQLELVESLNYLKSLESSDIPELQFEIERKFARSKNDRYVSRECGLLKNFEEKLLKLYEDYAEKPWIPVGGTKCLLQLKAYQKDLEEKHPTALRMCDSWGEPYR